MIDLSNPCVNRGFRVARNSDFTFKDLGHKFLDEIFSSITSCRIACKATFLNDLIQQPLFRLFDKDWCRFFSQLSGSITHWSLPRASVTPVPREASPASRYW